MGSGLNLPLKDLTIYSELTIAPLSERKDTDSKDTLSKMPILLESSTLTKSKLPLDPLKKNITLHDKQKRNPLTNNAAMHRLNPYDRERKAAARKAIETAKTNKATRLTTRRAARKTNKKFGRKFFANCHNELSAANSKTERDYKDYIKSIRIGKDAMKEEVEE